MRTNDFGKLFIFIPVLLILLWTGCASSVSQEQYQSLQTELNAVKEQLASKNAELESLKAQTSGTKGISAAPRRIWDEMQPYLDLNTLLLDDMITLSLQSSKQITTSYANIQYAEQRERLAAILAKIDDREFAEVVKAAWDNSETTDAQTKFKYWAQTYKTLRDYLENKRSVLNDQLTK